MESRSFTLPETYDQMALRMIPYAEIANLIKAKLDKYLPSAQAILDIACGTGNLSIPLAQRGYKVTGLDLSPEMLALARQKTVEAKEVIEYFHQDMTEPYPIAQLDAVTCFYIAVSFLNSLERLERGFTQVYKSLKPGGLFLFDQFTPAKMRRLYIGTDGGDLDNFYVVTQGKCNEARQLENKLTYFFKEAAGSYRSQDEVEHLRIHEFEELEEVLTKVGFKLLEAEEMYPNGVSYRGFREGHLFVIQKPV
jgi:SAM-dependent methyltransferase